MIMSDKKVYPLNTQFGSLVWGRNMAVALRDQVIADKCRTVVIDFAGVSMVTRAFADELIKVKRFLEEKGNAVSFVNMSNDVSPMFELVQAGRSSS